MTSAPTRPQPLQEAASIKTHGHLALLEWDALLPIPTSTAMKPFKNPTRRTVLDRCYEGGTVALFVSTIAALAVSLCRF